MLAQDLFNQLDPPTVTLTCHGLTRPDDQERLVTLAIRPPKGRTIVCSWRPDRYAPEWSILKAAAAAILQLSRYQGPLTHAAMVDAVAKGRIAWEEPF